MATRPCDAIGFLRLQQQMEPSDCLAVLKDGSKIEVFMYKDKPTIAIDNQFYFADSYSGFARYEKKPIAAPTLKPPVQETDNWAGKDDPIAGSASVQIAERWNSSQLYRRNLERESFSALTVEKYVGRDPKNPEMKYYRCKCKCGRRDCYIVASQADLLMQRVRSCRDKRPIPDGITNDGPRTKAGLF